MTVPTADVSQSELMRHLSHIAAEVRLSGTPEEARAFDYAAGELARWGYVVNRYSCPALTGYPERSTLVMVAPERRDFLCNGYSLSPATPEDGIEGALVDARDGSPADFAAIDARGRIVITDGLATPAKALAAARAGAIGHIHINGDHIHEMCISPIWGTPTPETAHLLPSVPAVAVTGETGAALRDALARGPVMLALTTVPYYGWSEIPVLTADLPGAVEDTYVLFSGHIDSWHLGVMDNGTANATQMELARIFAEHKGELRRGIRLAFWSGHSHARYAGSTWYADTFFDDLGTRCVAHVNIDSVGARGAVVLEEAPTMAETYAYTRDVLKAAGDVDLNYHRISRSSDQSFWGHGVPTTLAALSEQLVDDSPTSKAHAALLGAKGRAGGLGWWWHTTEDTLDKIDPEFLERDARLYLAVLWGLLTRDRLPYEPAAGLRELAEGLRDHERAAAGQLALADLAARADALASRIAALPLATMAAADANTLVMDLCRRIIVLNYTGSGPHDHDLALGTAPAAGLRDAVALGKLDPASSEARFLKTRLVRARNRVSAGLRDLESRLDGAS